jgi:hypothetical protein
VTIIVDVKLLSKDKTSQQLLYAVQDPFLIQIEQKLGSIPTEDGSIPDGSIPTFHS